MTMQPANPQSPKNQNSADPFHHELVKINKKAIFVLLSIVLGQLLLMNRIVDAGELTTESLLECTNAIRTQYHDNRLYINEMLNSAASEKLHDMQEYGYWAHGNPVTGEMPWDFVDRAGYYYETTGENLALGFETAQEICDAWEESETHLANIADKTFQEVGFAVNKANLHKNGKGILVVQMFGSRDSFVAPEDSEFDESQCLTTQGCGDKAAAPESDAKILGVSSEDDDPIWAFISKNILLFVIITSYLVGKVLLVFFYDHKPRREAAKKRVKKPHRKR